MSKIFDIYEYNDNLYEKFILKILPKFDIWSIRPLQNPAKIFAHGLSSELNKLDAFFLKHLEKDYKPDLIIILANAQKHYPRLMLNSSKKYLKLSFNNTSLQNNPTPLFLFPQPYTKNALNNDIQIAGFNYNTNAEIQEIINQQVQDAEKSVRAEFEKTRIQKEAEAERQIHEMERKLEQFKLDLKLEEFRKKEILVKEKLNKKEQFLAKKIEEHNKQIGIEKENLKENTKIITTGLLKLCEKLFFDKKHTEQPKSELKDLPENTIKKKIYFDDDGGFEEVIPHSIKADEENLKILKKELKNLSPEIKRKLRNELMNEKNKIDNNKK